jgi:hypothetical protein
MAGCCASISTGFANCLLPDPPPTQTIFLHSISLICSSHAYCVRLSLASPNASVRRWVAADFSLGAGCAHIPIQCQLPEISAVF